MYTKEELIEMGFEGFISIENIANTNYALIPKVPGVYVIFSESTRKPVFLVEGTGGKFKLRNPNVDISKLEEAWVENSQILYIGKAGGKSSKATLYKRLKQYIKFGKGKNIGHWGGRYIWQLKDVNDLLVAWKPTPNRDPDEIETELITKFKQQLGKRPFANLVK